MSKKQEKKVYCKDCKKLKETFSKHGTGQGSIISQRCYCDNKDVVYFDTWYDVEVDKNKLPDPAKLNANNDCKNFEKKEV